MDDPRDVYRKAGDVAGKVISQITPEQLSLPTPCAGWNVRDVIEHVVSGQRRSAARLAGEQAPDEDRDVLGDHPAADFRASFAALNGVFGEPGFLERTVPTPLGEAPGAQFVSMRVAELTLHAWDLAVATGQPRLFDPDVVSFASGVMHTLPVPRSAEGPFGPEQVVPAGAVSDADLLAAYTGRTVPDPGRPFRLPEETRGTQAT
jgi:uncharacterized protein (TIGR03086 family)